MVDIGYKLSSEEHGPLDLVCYAKQAEDAGFAFAMISDQISRAKVPSSGAQLGEYPRLHLKFGCLPVSPVQQLEFIPQLSLRLQPRQRQ